MNEVIAYIPILTTVFSAYFLVKIWAHYRTHKSGYLLWWTFGVLTFGLGTLCESIHALAGWHPLNLRIWYIVGALLGGFPLAQGSVYLLMKRRFADFTSILFGILILIAAVFVSIVPIVIPEGFDYHLTGKVFAWRWVRAFSPFINIYSFLWLVGGAIYSASLYYRQGERQVRFRGNTFIAIGGLLPGIGGMGARIGHLEVLFITELIGIILIFIGYRIIRLDKHRPVWARV